MIWSGNEHVWGGGGGGSRVGLGMSRSGRVGHIERIYER